MFSLIFGLGNPGPEYVGTRHNVGLMVLEAIARRWKLSWRPERWGPAFVAHGKRELLISPLRYMNESGVVVRNFLQRLGKKPEEIFVVVDDITLPLGKLRLRPGGSSGGHRGLLSVASSLGTEGFGRLRCGIGPLPPGIDLADFVLARFRDEELSGLEAMVEQAVDAFECCQEYGIEVAMSRFNA
ncbi:aminoacyl-tRNA hydrolase [Methylacidimicrobium sp. B4]|uniref:aminoacyl-tRNA hydrolase n=1 Tax=Methylacidimicrobium sp. B4 TaxID=2796139 RepID=UPI001F5CA36F|nr:aminoacyl-tRNA hydrolase [Methylacidimicrobium sp. B4]